MAYSTTGAPQSPSRQTILGDLGRRHLHGGKRGYHNHHLCLAIAMVYPHSRNLYGSRPQQRPPLRQGALRAFLCMVAVQPSRREVGERRPLRRPDHSPSNGILRQAANRIYRSGSILLIWGKSPTLVPHGMRKATRTSTRQSSRLKWTSAGDTTEAMARSLRRRNRSKSR